MDAPVNIDQLKIRLLMICKSKNQFEGVANYLIRRGWETTISASIKDAFKTISVFKPDFVLVSVNIPTAKISQLPMVITNTFKTNTVIFCETSDAKSMKLIQTIEAQYKIMGSASGPAVHRRIKQILQEIHQPKATTEKKGVGDAKGSGTDSLMIKGSAVNGDNSSVKMDGGTIIQKGATLSGSANSGGTFVQSGNASASEGSIRSGSGDDLMALAASFQESDVPELAGSELSELDEAATEDEVDSARRANETENGENGAMLETNAGALNSPVAKAETEASARATAEAAAKLKTEADASAKAATETQVQHNNTDVFKKIMEIANTCALPPNAHQHAIESFTEITIIPICGPSTNTYIALAGLGAIEEELHFSNVFMPRLKMELGSQFPSLQVGENQRIEFELISVHDKIEREINSSRLKNGSGEILIKHLDEAKYEAQIRLAGESVKAEIEPGDLVPNASVGVAVFLHLKKNGKYYLYLKPRSRISEKQKGRLISEQSKLFINKNDSDAYRAVLRKNKTFESFFDLAKRRKTAA